MQTCLTAEFRLFHVVAYILITLKSTVLKRKCQIDCIMEARGILQIIRTFWGETTINVGNVGWRKDLGIITNSVIKESVNSPYCMIVALDSIVLPETQRQKTSLLISLIQMVGKLLGISSKTKTSKIHHRRCKTLWLSSLKCWHVRNTTQPVCLVIDRYGLRLPKQ